MPKGAKGPSIQEANAAFTAAAFTAYDFDKPHQRQRAALSKQHIT